MADVQPPTREDSLSPLQLADGLLENVTKCPDCAKPVLQSAMADHQATCQAIREGRVPDNAPLKRRLSEASNGSSVPLKKSKLVLHLGGPAADKPKQQDAPKKNKRFVDVDRQCGVINDKGYPCPRSLTCKTHNMSAKRAVPHRSQPYDLLLFEWQKANKANQQKSEAAKLAQTGGTPSSTSGGTTRLAAAAAAAPSDASTPLAAPPLMADLSGSGATTEPPKPKRKRSGIDAATSGVGTAFKVPGEKKGKKGVVYVGEWEESDDDGADELVDSDEEVEAVLRGLARADHGRPLFISRGGGAGFSAASMFTGRNAKLARLRGTLRDIFRPAA